MYAINVVTLKKIKSLLTYLLTLYANTYPVWYANNYPPLYANTYPVWYANDYPPLYANTYPVWYANDYPPLYANTYPVWYANNYPPLYSNEFFHLVWNNKSELIHIKMFGIKMYFSLVDLPFKLGGGM